MRKLSVSKIGVLLVFCSCGTISLARVNQPPTAPVLVGAGYKGSATSVDGAHAPEFAVDGNVMDRNKSWWARGTASLTVDLQKNEKVMGFQVYPYWDGHRYYQYAIEVSSDGKKWNLAVDMSKNTKKSTPNGYLHSFKVTMPTGLTCRYVRLNMLKNSANPGVHVVEFKVFDQTLDF